MANIEFGLFDPSRQVQYLSLGPKNLINRILNNETIEKGFPVRITHNTNIARVTTSISQDFNYKHSLVSIPGHRPDRYCIRSLT